MKSPITLGRGEPGPPSLTVWFGRDLRCTLAILTLWGANALRGAILALCVFQLTVRVPTDVYGLVPNVVAQLVPVLATSAPLSWPVMVMGGGSAGELHPLRVRERSAVSSPLAVPARPKTGIEFLEPRHLGADHGRVGDGDDLGARRHRRAGEQHAGAHHEQPYQDDRGARLRRADP